MTEAGNVSNAHRWWQPHRWRFVAMVGRGALLYRCACGKADVR